MTDPRKPYAAALRAAGIDFNRAGVIAAFDDMLDNAGIPRAGHVAPAAVHPAPHPTNEPRWMIEARARIGEKEIPGPKHNAWIAAGWKRLGAGWFTDDETPWCGLFVAHCIEFARLPFPKLFPRAMEWAKWGVPCQPAVGAVVVFKRSGGGHVGFLVGENAANYYVLGGNQKNEVNIMPIAKNRAVATRWPAGMALPTPGLPRMTGGVVSTNEQ